MSSSYLTKNSEDIRSYIQPFFVYGFKTRASAWAAFVKKP